MNDSTQPVPPYFNEADLYRIAHYILDLLPSEKGDERLTDTRIMDALRPELITPTAEPVDWRAKHDALQDDLDAISEAFPADAPHKQPDTTGVSLLDDVRDALRDKQRAEAEAARLKGELKECELKGELNRRADRDAMTSLAEDAEAQEARAAKAQKRVEALEGALRGIVCPLLEVEDEGKPLIRLTVHKDDLENARVTLATEVAP